MTRIALCYSGRPRSILECYNNHVQYFGLGNSNVDVFAHLWFDQNLVGTNFRNDVNQGTWPDESIKSWIDENWKPKTIVYEKPRSFEHMFAGEWEKKLQWHHGHQKDHQISMFYGIEKVINLKKEYEEKNNFKYDYVMRIRTDLLFLEDPGNFENYDKNKLHVFNVIPQIDWIQTGVKDYGILDIVAWGGSDIMDKYSTTYSNLQKLLDLGCPSFSSDAFLGFNATKIHDIEVQKHPWKFKIFVGDTIYQN